jgi:ribosomal protein S18 acetylase RimI-like enzyme
VAGPDAQARFLYVDSGEPVAHARTLFQEYQSEIGVDLCFQGFAAELAGLPRPYVPPDGRLLLALHDVDVAGCAGLRALGDGIGELKRLYVRPAFRGRGIARRLAAMLLEDAREIGYRAVRLDTLATMTAARALYQALGFREIPPYTANPLPDVKFYELTLAPVAA